MEQRRDVCDVDGLTASMAAVTPPSTLTTNNHNNNSHGPSRANSITSISNQILSRQPSTIVSKGQQQQQLSVEQATAQMHHTNIKKVNFSPTTTTAGSNDEVMNDGDLGNRDLLTSRASISSGGENPQPACPKSQKKFISTWRMACDKTKDRTKELLKRWRTMPEEVADAGEQDAADVASELTTIQGQEEHNWSVHVWATWVKRYPNDDDNSESEKLVVTNLTSTQKEKLSHFFWHSFDMDRDDMISLQDFESFSERLRHYADWSLNCGESVILEQVQQGFIETFILPLKPDNLSQAEHTAPMVLDRLFLSLEEWLCLWSDLLLGVKNFHSLPIWLQYFPKVIFHAINKTGSGVITRDELGSFYSSVMGFPMQKVNEILDDAYKAMTANGDYKLTYPIYRLCFANFLLGRFPNGPGQFIFGFGMKQTTSFPIDYSAMNTLPEDLEQYSPDRRSNRCSVIV